ncbi:imm11 family protein [Agrobacterium sp. rho-13.3]|uniref:imm11 family protein n=1 Tax=Agrobacterium sp. rho-13.3 TaxID=3072980 RepID=UPI002A24B178|nr:DUF1629 domain-containing protein [Agrobacterium sp. rho-13.3]
MEARKQFQEYFTVHQNMEIPDQWYLGIAESAEMEFWGWEFEVGKSYEGPTPVYVPIAREGKKQSLSFGGINALHVSTKDLSKLMRNIDDQIQFVSASVGDKRMDYTITNALVTIDAIDYEKTKGQKYDDDQVRKNPKKNNIFKHIRELHLLRSPVNGHDFFRLNNSLGTLVVSAKFKANAERLYKSNHGALFTPVSVSE